MTKPQSTTQPDYTEDDFHISTYSGDGTNCIEVAFLRAVPKVVGMGDSKLEFNDPRHRFTVSRTGFDALISSIKADAFPMPA